VPLLEEVREDRTQAVHCGHALVLRSDGSVAQSWGNPKVGAWWRSSAKPLQAVPFVESGAADAFGLGPGMVALACGSHNGELVHLQAARSILNAAGLTEADLGCGAHEPLGGPERCAPRPAWGWSAIHNPCSGKHAAMLAACVHNGWPTKGYLDPEHPLQRRIRALVGEMTREPVAWGTDGCSAPVFWNTLTGMARAFQAHDRTAVGRRIFDAMAAEPFMVAGTKRFCTALMASTAGRIVGKVGAGGLYVAVRRTTGEALAVKVSSGVHETTEQAAVELMNALGWLDDHEGDALAHFLGPRITTCLGKDLGTTRALF
jgi:L-asparaginase II